MKTIISSGLIRSAFKNVATKAKNTPKHTRIIAEHIIASRQGDLEKIEKELGEELGEAAIQKEVKQIFEKVAKEVDSVSKNDLYRPNKLYPDSLKVDTQEIKDGLDDYIHIAQITTHDGEEIVDQTLNQLRALEKSIESLDSTELNEQVSTQGLMHVIMRSVLTDKFLNQFGGVLVWPTIESIQDAHKYQKSLEISEKTAMVINHLQSPVRKSKIANDKDNPVDSSKFMVVSIGPGVTLEQFSQMKQFAEWVADISLLDDPKKIAQEIALVTSESEFRSYYAALPEHIATKTKDWNMSAAEEKAVEELTANIKNTPEDKTKELMLGRLDLIVRHLLSAVLGRGRVMELEKEQEEDKSTPITGKEIADEALSVAKKDSTEKSFTDKDSIKRIESIIDGTSSILDPHTELKQAAKLDRFINGELPPSETLETNKDTKKPNTSRTGEANSGISSAAIVDAEWKGV